MEYVNKMRQIGTTAKARPTISKAAMKALHDTLKPQASLKAAPQPADPPKQRVTVKRAAQYDNGLVDALVNEMRRQRGQ